MCVCVCSGVSQTLLIHFVIYILCHRPGTLFMSIVSPLVFGVINIVFLQSYYLSISSFFPCTSLVSLIDVLHRNGHPTPFVLPQPYPIVSGLRPSPRVLDSRCVESPS